MLGRLRQHGENGAARSVTVGQCTVTQAAAAGSLTQRKGRDNAMTKLRSTVTAFFAVPEILMSLSSRPASPSADAAAAGDLPSPARTVLAGKNLGLLCDDPALEEALLACRAASELGARVSLVRPRLDGERERDALLETAHLLGRLYDVIACVALPAELVAALRDAAGVPVVGDVDLDSCPPVPGATTDFAADRLRRWALVLAASQA